MPSLTSLRGVDTRKWVSGTTYGVDTVVWSPANFLMYVRTVAGSGTTDPSADATNWALFGPTRRKQLQYVNVTWTGGSGFSIATAAISAVVAARCRAKVVYAFTGTSAVFLPAVISFPSATTVSVDIGTALPSTTTARIEIDENW